MARVAQFFEKGCLLGKARFDRRDLHVIRGVLFGLQRSLLGFGECEGFVEFPELP